MQSVPYGQAVGSRPDITYAAEKVSRFLENPQIITRRKSELLYACPTHASPTSSNDSRLYKSLESHVRIPGSDAKLPVLVNIHGGTFIRGSANVGDPQFILEQNVIVITCNYRLGPFGFLSTGDTVIPGNMGLKDQQFVLKWVKRNIHLFGGDSEKVTLMGQSAGSASVTYHLLSSSSAGLFRAAIGQSGSALNPWAFNREAIETAYGIAAEINPGFGKNRSSQELLEILCNADSEMIHAPPPNINLLHPLLKLCMKER
ncbi:hypothetical protein JTB14_013433 [Gonioctena quinquepunctata]|nr:hypothetical protein JTB14_013433 [Gonioctena quinquepunctata]